MKKLLYGGFTFKRVSFVGACAIGLILSLFLILYPFNDSRVPEVLLSGIQVDNVVESQDSTIIYLADSSVVAFQVSDILRTIPAQEKRKSDDVVITVTKNGDYYILDLVENVPEDSIGWSVLSIVKTIQRYSSES